MGCYSSKNYKEEKTPPAYIESDSHEDEQEEREEIVLEILEDEKELPKEENNPKCPWKDSGCPWDPRDLELRIKSLEEKLRQIEKRKK